MPRIEFDGVSKRYPDGTIAVHSLDLTVEDRMLMCVLGPSGCGKSSTLRMLAGLEAVTSGEIRVDGHRINEMASQERDFAMVFENYALYPHLTVAGNLAMPLLARHMDRSEIQRRIDEVAALLQIADQLGKRPNQLSGGQRQRVGLGRAIIRDTRTFLMDEPLGHLEAYLRVQLRTEVRRLHERLGATTFYITHDQEEAAAISDRIAVMADGRLQQIGTLIELLDQPANRFVAEFIGDIPINMAPASFDGPQSLAVGPAQILVSGATAALMSTSVGGRVDALGIRPHDVAMHHAPADDRLPGTVVLVEPIGDTSVVITETDVGRFSAVVESTDAPADGAPIYLGFDPGSVHLFDSAGNSLVHGIAD